MGNLALLMDVTGKVSGDYGWLGHAEVVSLELPTLAAQRVFEHFLDSVCVSGYRRDLQDEGAEYRSLVGLPGGLEGELGQVFASVAHRRDVVVHAGEGSDGDTSGAIWVMDTAKFPFHQAEDYHQFHDDMVDAYGNTYNNLREKYTAQGTINYTGCPQDEDWRTVGILSVIVALAAVLNVVLRRSQKRCCSETALIFSAIFLWLLLGFIPAGMVMAAGILAEFFASKLCGKAAQQVPLPDASPLL